MLRSKISQLPEFGVSLAENSIGEAEEQSSGASSVTLIEGPASGGIVPPPIPDRQTPPTNRYSYRQAIYSRNAAAEGGADADIGWRMMGVFYACVLWCLWERGRGDAWWRESVFPLFKLVHIVGRGSCGWFLSICFHFFDYYFLTTVLFHTVPFRISKYSLSYRKWKFSYVHIFDHLCVQSGSSQLFLFLLIFMEVHKNVNVSQKYATYSILDAIWNL